jgi:cold-inducible RNA-binding protein
MYKDAAAAAIAKFSSFELDGRTINVNEARPHPERNFGGGGGRRGGGYG